MIIHQTSSHPTLCKQLRPFEKTSLLKTPLMLAVLRKPSGHRADRLHKMEDRT